MVVPSVVRLVGLLILLSVNDIDTAGGVAHASAAQVVHRMGLHAFIVAQRGGGDACRLLTQCLHVVARQNEVVREGLVPPCCITVAVVGALEVGAAGIIGARIVVPRHEEQPLAASIPLRADGRHVATLCQCYEFGG